MTLKETTIDRAGIENLKKQMNRLAGILLEQLGGEDAEANTVFSSYSIFTLLAMAADATAGETREEILDAILGGADPEQVLGALKEIREQLTAGQAFTEANAVIIREDKKDSITPGYPEHLRKLFGGELFASDDMVSAVNRWVNRHSKGMIPEIVDESMKEMLLCLLNACTFIARWEDEYEYYDIKNMDFHNRDGSVSRVKALRSGEDVYIENSCFTGFAKPYKGGQFSYVVLLPKKVVRLTEEVISSLDYSELLKGVENTQASVLMPEFRITADYDLTGLCKKLGIRRIFTPEADFSPASREWLMAEQIKHKAHIEVDREGTKAAAVTAMMVVGGGVPTEWPEIKDVTVDRPFLYAVVHNETGLPVFVGTVNRLEPAEGDDLLTDDEKEALCKPVYDSICGVILYKDGSPKAEYDYRLLDKIVEAYEEHDLKALKEIEEQLKKG